VYGQGDGCEADIPAPAPAATSLQDVVVVPGGDVVANLVNEPLGLSLELSPDAPRGRLVREVRRVGTPCGPRWGLAATAESRR
jgi:hypothetical protein